MPTAQEIKDELNERMNRAITEYAEKHGLPREEVLRNAIEMLQVQDQSEEPSAD